MIVVEFKLLSLTITLPAVADNVVVVGSPKLSILVIEIVSCEINVVSELPPDTVAIVMLELLLTTIFSLNTEVPSTSISCKNSSEIINPVGCAASIKYNEYYDDWL